MSEDFEEYKEKIRKKKRKGTALGFILGSLYCVLFQIYYYFHTELKLVAFLFLWFAFACFVISVAYYLANHHKWKH